MCARVLTYQCDENLCYICRNAPSPYTLFQVLAAKSARMRCIAVPEPGTAAGSLVRFAIADLVGKPPIA